MPTRLATRPAPTSSSLSQRTGETDAETIGRSGGTDFFKVGEQPTPAEYAVWERVRRFVDDEVLPVVDDYWERAEFPGRWPSAYDSMPPTKRVLVRR